jgi:hypothetical protein
VPKIFRCGAPLSFSAKVSELVRMAVEEVLKNGRH